MRAKVTVLVLAAVTALSGVTYAVVRSRLAATGISADHRCGDHEEGRHERIEITGLETAPATVGEGWDVLQATGTVVVPPDRLVRITPRIEGRVVAVHCTAGDAVRRGQVLAVISSMDLAEARSQHRQALARFSAAQRNLDQETRLASLEANSARPLEEARSGSLEAQSSLSDAGSELSQVRSELVQAESELAQCRARLDRARELHVDKIISRNDLEAAETEYRRDSAAVDAAQARVRQAEARVENAKSRSEIARQYLAREQKLYTGKVLDARALQSARAEVESARIEVQAAADRIRVLGARPGELGDTIAITSPIAGRVVSRHTSVGEMAAPSDALLIVADLASVWIEADIHETDIARVREGQPVEVRTEAYPERVATGKVDAIGDLLAPESRTARVRCAVANREGLLKGGMLARVSLMVALRGNTVLIPKHAVLDDSGSKVVFTPCSDCPEDVRAGTNACGSYDKLVVETGAIQGDRVEVLKGLEPGTLVVTKGHYQLKTALGSGKLEAGCSH